MNFLFWLDKIDFDFFLVDYKSFNGKLCVCVDVFDKLRLVFGVCGEIDATRIS